MGVWGKISPNGIKYAFFGLLLSNTTEGEEILDTEEKIAYILVMITPEIDTIRIMWRCGSLVDLDAFFEGEGLKRIAIVERDPMTHEITNHWEKIRADHRKSWYGKMQIIDDRDAWGLRGKNWTRALTFEFSLAKWFNYSNGLNLDVKPQIGLAVDACLEAIKALHLLQYTKFKSFEKLAVHFSDNIILRRLDLSKNFKVPEKYDVDDWIALLGRMVINNQKATSSGTQGKGLSMVWASPRSPYRIQFYNKEKEQNRFFHLRDYADSPEQAKHRLMYYQLIKPQLKNVLRFEINFKFPYFRDLTKPNAELKFIEKPDFELDKVQLMRKKIMKNGLKGEKNIQNVIDYTIVKWRSILDLFKKQIDYTNFSAGEASRIQDNSGIEFVLDQIEKDSENGDLSATIANNMKCFLLDCFKYGFLKVQRKMRKEKFYFERKRILLRYNYDVKILLPAEVPLKGERPIMCITESIFQSFEVQNLKFIKFIPAPKFDSRSVAQIIG